MVHRNSLFSAVCLILAWVVPACLPAAPAPNGSRIDEILDRTGRAVELFWEQLPSYNCRESVTREKLEKKGKAEFRQTLEFDYVALTKTRNGHFTVEEARLPLKNKPEKSEPPSLLESNGFPTLQLIFHPRYQANYRFVQEEGYGGTSIRIHFEHIHGAGSTSAVLVQGVAHALELEGTAWIDSESGTIQKISANLMNPMEGINVEKFSAEVVYQPQHLENDSELRWLPSSVMIELQTKSQHWRNMHHYSEYRRFRVESEGTVPK